MGSIANQVTSPVGVKLFSGGPYADNGAGDKMQGQADKGMAQAQAFQQQLAQVIAQISQSAGVANPAGTNPGADPNAGADPYGLSPLQQSAVNNQASQEQEAYKKILSTVKAHLSASGFGDSSTMAAAESYLGQQLQAQIGTERIQAGENAYGNRMNALQSIAGLLGQGFGAQQGALNTGIGVSQYQGQVAEQAHAQAMQQLGAFIGLLGGQGAFGKNFPGYGVPGAKAPQPAAPMYSSQPGPFVGPPTAGQVVGQGINAAIPSIYGG